VIWLYARREEVLELETAFRDETAEYVLELRTKAGAPQTERFSDGVAFRTRLLALEHRLADQQWRPHGPPVICADGWSGRKVLP